MCQTDNVKNVLPTEQQKGYLLITVLKMERLLLSFCCSPQTLIHKITAFDARTEGILSTESAESFPSVQVHLLNTLTQIFHGLASLAINASELQPSLRLQTRNESVYAKCTMLNQPTPNATRTLKYIFLPRSHF